MYLLVLNIFVFEFAVNGFLPRVIKNILIDFRILVIA